MTSFVARLRLQQQIFSILNLMDHAPGSEMIYHDGATFLLLTRRHGRNNDLEKRAFLTIYY